MTSEHWEGVSGFLILLLIVYTSGICGNIELDYAFNVPKAVAIFIGLIAGIVFTQIMANHSDK